MYESRCQDHINENIELENKLNDSEKGAAELKALVHILRKQVTELTDEHFDTLVYLSTLNDLESIHKAITDIFEDKQ